MDYLAGALILIGTYLLSRGSPVRARQGFVALSIGNILWIYIGMSKSIPGLVFSSVLLLALNVRGFKNWT